MFFNFYFVKNHKIDKNSATTKAREKLINDSQSLDFLDVWLNLKTIKFYLINLATDFYGQPSYLLGEGASLHEINYYSFFYRKMSNFTAVISAVP